MAAGETPIRRRGGWLTTFCVFLASVTSCTNGQMLKGGSLVKTACSEEGAIIALPFKISDPCIVCMCKNHIVKCNRKTCEKLDDCALVVKSLGRDCCEQCKTCIYNGDVYNSGSRWWTVNLESGQHEHLQCQEGVITSSSVQCEPPCSHPTYSNDAICPICPGCMLNDDFMEEGDTSPKENDPCLECTCQNGGLSCSRRTCPVLSCPSYQIETPPGECCPKCMAQRRVFELGDRCLFGGEIFEDGKVVFQENCTTCTCYGSATVMCKITQCTIPDDCPLNELTTDEGSCCPRCTYCAANGDLYENDMEWTVSPCETCHCDRGETHCEVNTCEGAPQACPERETLEIPEGECCPRCVEYSGTCTVFGDPHYRTFDGQLFNFQGRCKYLLTADCTDNAFKIRVRNDGRGSRSASWSKTVFIHVGEHTITLRQGKNVRVNRTNIALPFTDSSVGHINNENYVVTVHLNIGVKVLWDGDSFIEVTASTNFKNKLCGLCGDYDGDIQNDFRTIKGDVVRDANVFASSWRIGSKDECDVSESKTLDPPCRKKPYAKAQARRECKIIKSSDFESCKGVVDQWVYYRSCMTDVCECGPTYSCACEAIMAFIRECERHGIILPYAGNCIK